jgi:cellulose synthase/poly-beta-1,6-N-acetylglucosamine synthase-like glycosyltransferase
VYLGYPILVYLVGRFFGKKVLHGDVEPTVTVIITAYNEEAIIRAKIENTLMIDYPKEKLKILVASDGSSDDTESIVRGFESKGVILFRQDGRLGKTATQNAAVERADGEIILFSDATSMYQPNVLRSIVRNFADSSVGCVAGKLIYVDDSNSNVGTGAKSYWNYETFLKENESLACSLIGVSGCVYAVRKEAYVPMYPEACSDFLIATLLYRQGLRTVYEPAAICVEQTNQKTGTEMTMRVRVISQTFTDLWRNRDMLNPVKAGFYSLQLLSHKLLRYAVPIFLVLAFFSSLVLTTSSILFVIIFTVQAVFYLTAWAAWILEKYGRKSSILAVPLYFVLANIASAAGFYKFVVGERYASWEPVRGA